MMNNQDMGLTLISCLFFMALVAFFSYKASKDESSSRDGYFLAGRNLSAMFIAGSLLLTNLSAEQLIGLNGSAYGFNLSSMGWEVTAAFATIAMAFVFLPRYLAGAFSTLPEFLNNRFDDDVRRLTVILFMLGYGLVTIPSVLYSGSIAVLQLFDVPNLFDITYSLSLVLTIIVIGSVGAVYAIFGGLRAVAVSDTLNGIGLLIIGIAVPILGLSMLGEGSVASGLKIVSSTNTEKLNAIGSSGDPTPFATLFTGMIFANLFYWCANQYVIQRTLGAKSLAEGQKGVLFSGFFKVLVPIMMMIPGIIAFHLYGGPNSPDGLGSIDLAYPRLIRDVLPTYASGFFLAVLLGAVFSSFNSLLNSAATLFCLDVYEPWKKSRGCESITDEKILRVAKKASIVIALFAFIVAPLLQFAPDGLWQIIRIFTGFYNIPVIAIVIVGLFSKRVPSLGPKIVIGFHIITYGILKFALDDIVTLHFIHLYAVLFFIEVGIMMVVGHYHPTSEDWTYERSHAVDMQPWYYGIPCAISLISCVVGLYLLFSPVGLVGGISALFLPLIWSLILLNVAVWLYYVSSAKLPQ